jgi:hypothetical protein
VRFHGSWVACIWFEVFLISSYSSSSNVVISSHLIESCSARRFDSTSQTSIPAPYTLSSNMRSCAWKYLWDGTEERLPVCVVSDHVRDFGIHRGIVDNDVSFRTKTGQRSCDEVTYLKLHTLRATTWWVCHENGYGDPTVAVQQLQFHIVVVVCVWVLGSGVIW